jgi:hypothetical protein
MSCRKRYLSYLADKGLSEKDVVPILSHRPTATLLQSIGEGVQSGELTDMAYAKVLIEAALGWALPTDISESDLLELVDRVVAVSSANANALLEYLSTNLRERLLCAGIDLPDSLCFGVFPTRSFNAFTVGSADGPLVLLDNGCFQIAEVASHSVACHLAGFDVRSRFVEILERYWILKQLPDDKIVDSFRNHLSDDQRMIAIKLTSAVEDFAIAHEYGHVAMGHNQTTPVTAQSLYGNIEVRRRGWENEHSADMWAAEVLSNAAKQIGDHEVEVCFAGMMIFLGVASLMELYSKWKGTYCDTHPPALDRCDRIHQQMISNKLDQCLDIGRACKGFTGDCAHMLTGGSL